MKNAKMLKDAAVLVAGAAIGNTIAEMYVLQSEPDGPGFVPIKYGFGPDDLARGVLIAAVTLALQKVV
jgi:hypothetical protein